MLQDIIRQSHVKSLLCLKEMLRIWLYHPHRPSWFGIQLLPLFIYNSTMSLKVTLLGTGVGIPQPGRSQSALLMENESPLLFDCGAGTLLRLADAGIDMQDLDTVVLTHLHLDHCADVLPLANARYLMGLLGLVVCGPVGTLQWLQAQRSAYPYLEKMVVSVHEIQPMDAVYLKGCDIFAEEARHSVTALAYRMDCGDKSVVYSGDTEASTRVAAFTSAPSQSPSM
jgi:ribonuclease Z